MESDTFYPALYYYNEEIQQLEYVEGQRRENGKVVASLSHFSKYILLNKIEFDKVWTYTFFYDEEAQNYGGLDVAFVIDTSGSMSWNDPYDVRKMVTKNFIDRLTEFDMAAVISFDHNMEILAGFTNDKEILATAVDKLDSSGGTDLSVGISAAISLFNGKIENEDRLKYIIMLTDGEGSYSSIYTTQASSEEIVIYTIGLGNSVSKSVLTNMAVGTGGCYYHVDEAEELYAIFETIAEESDYYKDTDNDGLNDYYEKEMAAKHLVLGTGASLAEIDYLEADSDGDGLLDGEEIEIRKFGEYTYVYMYSNPTVLDTDKDGMQDVIDKLPLVANMSELLIHQTEYGEGLKKKTAFSENIVADDLTFNDYSYTEIVEQVSVFGTVAGITPEFLMWDMLSILFLLGDINSDDEMCDTLMDMLNEFRYGNNRNIGIEINEGDKFNTELYNRYTDEVLTNRVVNYPAVNKYVKDIKDIVVNVLENNGGNLQILAYTGSDLDIIREKALMEEVMYPKFALKDDVALTLAIHDFQGHNIMITDYVCDGERFSGTLKFHFYDHFGLDNDDYEWAPGFCDWFTLQHYDRFDGKYAPFITVVDTDINFAGVIK